MSKRLKQLILDEFVSDFEGVSDLLFVDFHGMTSEQTVKLRTELREQSIRFKVVKNSLARKAFEKFGVDRLDAVFHGNTAVVLHPDDPVAAAKAIVNCKKTYKQIKIKGGLAEGMLVDESAVTEIAKIPSKDALIGRILGLMQGPACQIITQARNPGARILGAIEALVEKRETGPAPDEGETLQT